MTQRNVAPLPLKADAAQEYHAGDQDTRPWGHYIVTAVGRTPEGEEYCEKEITVKPWNILSLQSHELRRETWTVKRGTLTALVDGCRIELRPGESVEIPQKSIHCMANLSDEDCVVHERQTGTCRESDIRRYIDAYNRATEAAPATMEGTSVILYRDILTEIGMRRDAA